MTYTEPQPAITFYTPTYRRPEALARCLASVQAQTDVAHLEHLVLPDHVGRGVEKGLFGRIPWYASACRGQYVHILGDDDALADPQVVADFRRFIAREQPPVIVWTIDKNGKVFPKDHSGPPVLFRVDLGSYVLRRDVWLRHAHEYGDRYAGDFDHARALWEAGYPVTYFDRLCVVGGRGKGRAEVAA